jgi:hypothetical protein
MVARIVDVGAWRGVEVSWVGKIQRIDRGMEVAVQYLTAPGSSLVLLRMLLKNKTTSPMAFAASFIIDSVFNGTTEGTMLRTEWKGETTNIRVGPMPFAAVPETRSIWFRSAVVPGQGLGIVTGEESSMLMGLSIPGSVILGTLETTLVKPNDERSISHCLFVDPRSDEDLADMRQALPYLTNSASS